MTLSRTFWLLLLILIIAGFLRLYQITSVPPGLYPDEAINGNDALQALRTGNFKVFYTENNGREGLFMNIQALFLKFLLPLNNNQPEPWMLRLPSAIFGIMTVLGIYFLAKELFADKAEISFSPKPPQLPRHGPLVSFFNRAARQEGQASESLDERSGLRKNEILALLSSFLLAVNFWHINFSRIGFRAIMAPFFLVWALYFFLKSPNSKHGISYSIIAGVFYGLGFYSYIAYRVTPLLFLAFVPFYWKDKKFWRVAAAFILITFIVALPLGIYFIKHPADFFGRTSEISVSGSPSPLKNLSLNVLKTLGMFFVRGDSNSRHNYNSEPELFWPIGILFLIGAILAIKNIIQNLKIKNQNDNSKIKFAFYILILWFTLALLPVVISNEGLPHALRSILMIPPVFILAGAGGIWLYDFLKKYARGLWLPLVSVITLSLFIFQPYFVYFTLWAQNPDTAGAFSADYAALGRKLNQLPREIPKYVVVQAGGILVNGIPMPAQTMMFLTDTFTPENQKEKNVYYVLPDGMNKIPAGSFVAVLK